MPDDDTFPDIDGVSPGQFDVADVEADQLGDINAPEGPEPPDGDTLNQNSSQADETPDDEAHYFRDKESERHQAELSSQEKPIGAMTVETLFMGAMVADESHVNASTIKAFLTKSSSIDSATSGIREMLRDSFFDAHDEKKDKDSPFSVEGEMGEQQAEVEKARAVNQQVKLACIIKKLAIVNVLRRQLRELQHDLG